MGRRRFAFAARCGSGTPRYNRPGAWTRPEALWRHAKRTRRQWERARKKRVDVDGPRLQVSFGGRQHARFLHTRHDAHLCAGAAGHGALRPFSWRSPCLKTGNARGSIECSFARRVPRLHLYALGDRVGLKSTDWGIPLVTALVTRLAEVSTIDVLSLDTTDSCPRDSSAVCCA